jgi:hypothetical protein
MAELDKVTVRAVGILADATAKNAGSGSMVHLKLLRAQSIATQPALDAAGNLFDRLPAPQRAGIRDDAEQQAQDELQNKAFDEVRDLYKGLTPIDKASEKPAAAQRAPKGGSSERLWSENLPKGPDRPGKGRVGFGS